jgi:formamidopyrimidine-DNA glycosylase
VPELPEVETVRRGLENLAVGWKISTAQDLHPRLLKESSVAPLANINGARILEAKRRGKFLWLVLNRPEVLVAHLGMSGQFLFHEAGKPRAKHARATFQLMRGLRKRELIFNDQRTFGWLSIEECIDGIPTSAQHIALDPFETGFDIESVVAKIRKRKVIIKTALLNQEIMSGVGNIYADESLWRAKVHPETEASSMSAVRIRRVIESAIEVMAEAIKAGGTSFDDMYINVNGESGFFEQSLNAYGLEGEPCTRCGTSIRRIAFANRSSHFCPKCQRK